MADELITEERSWESKALSLFSSLIKSSNFSSMKSGDKIDIALVNMPFYGIHWPSIQLGLLKSVLKENAYSVVDSYINLIFAQLIGFDLYKAIANTSNAHIGEWLFSWFKICELFNK